MDAATLAQARVQGDKRYTGKRAALRYDPSGKANGALASSLTADTGQSMTAFPSPTNGAQLAVSSGVLVNTTSGGGTSAGYLQANMGAPVTRLGCQASWATNALGVVALVIPSAAWSTGVLPNAGFHLSINGNGIWTLIRFTTGGTTTLADYSTHGRPSLMWGLGLQSIEVSLSAADGKAVIYWPDGTTSTISNAFLTSETGNYAIWELFANVGGTDVGASLGQVWADTAPIDPAAALSPYRAVKRNTPAVYNVSGTLTCDFSKTTMHEATLVGNITTLTFSNAPNKGQILHVELVQDGTGSRTLSGASTAIKWAGGTAPTLSTTAGRRDIFQFRQNAAGNYVEVSRSMNVG